MAGAVAELCSVYFGGVFPRETGRPKFQVGPAALLPGIFCLQGRLSRGPLSQGAGGGVVSNFGQLKLFMAGWRGLPFRK